MIIELAFFNWAVIRTVSTCLNYIANPCKSHTNRFVSIEMIEFIFTRVLCRLWTDWNFGTGFSFISVRSDLWCVLVILVSPRSCLDRSMLIYDSKFVVWTSNRHRDNRAEFLKQTQKKLQDVTDRKSVLVLFLRLKDGKHMICCIAGSLCARSFERNKCPEICRTYSFWWYWLQHEYACNYWTGTTETWSHEENVPVELFRKMRNMCQ